MKLHDSWYDSPRREGGRWVLGLLIEIEGQAAIHFYLTIPEMKEILLQLKHHGIAGGEVIERTATHPRNTAWWAYECVGGDQDDSGDGSNAVFALAGTVVADVPVCLYRDDHLLLYLPNEIGWEIIEIIEQRLALAGEALVTIPYVE